MKLASRLLVLLIAVGPVRFEGRGTVTPVCARELTFPPALPDGAVMASVTSPKLLESKNELRTGVTVAQTPPRVDFLYYPGQDHPGQPWSNWGDSLAANAKYYSAIGDHMKPRGTAQVYEYDPQTQQLRLLVDLRSFLEKSGALAVDEDYTSGKIHTRLDLGSDGWLYYAGHRGSTRTTNDAHGFRGERVFRTHPATGATEIVAEFPIAKHVIPMSVLDPRRMIFYGGTAAGEDAVRQGVWFFAYDVRNHSLLATAPDGPQRYAILARSTGRLYWEGHRYDPQSNQIRLAPQVPNVRCATRETPTGHVYGTSNRTADLWSFNVQTERVEPLGPGGVATAEYITTIDSDPSGRYLYYVPGAHGRAEDDGTPVIQYDVETKKRKVICFLAPVLTTEIGYTPIGTFGSAVSEDGSKLYITWNGYRQGAADVWDVCAMTVIHIPASERPLNRDDRHSQPAAGDNTTFRFRDVTAESGLLPDVAGLKGHAVAWGDADGNGWIDLYVGSFHTEHSQPNMFFRNRMGRFECDDAQNLRISSRPSGAVWADLDNDSDLDLYVSSMPRSDAENGGIALAGCTLFRNDGEAGFVNISAGNAACPAAFGGRSTAVLDYDGDGLLDLLVGEDPLPGYNGSPTHSSRLFRNRGNLEFEDATQRAGIPKGIPGLGVAAGDVNNDGWPDIFLACHQEGNRLFLNDGEGRFYEAPGTRRLFHWNTGGGDNMVCGVCFGDVNLDGLLDIVIGQHYERPWVTPVANRLYLNRGIAGGIPTFEDVTEAAGLLPLPMKAPHLEIADFDNDGNVDIYTSIVMFASEAPHPVIFRNTGDSDGIPRFHAEALHVTTFPTPADQEIRRSGEFFRKMIADRKTIYAAAAPSGDYDRDGRLDLFLASWWPELPSMLLRNETRAGHWLQVKVVGEGATNRMGVGSRVYVYESGTAGRSNRLLGCREIAVGYGYASSHEATAHFGLGERTMCDVEILLPHRREKLIRRGVRADQRITIRP